MAGLLDSSGQIDISRLQGLLAQFAPQQGDKDAARNQALIAMGLGLMGARKGQEFDTIGRSGLLGLGQYNKQLQEAPRLRMEQMQTAGQVVGLQEMLRKAQEAEQTRQATLEFARNRTNPAAGMPSLAPTNENAATLATHQASGNQDLYQRLLQQADFYESKGLAEPANQYRLLAEKYAPQYGGTKTVMQNGVPVLMQEYKNRAPQAVSGFQPPPDIALADTGGSLMPWDRLRPPTAPINKTMTPGEIASNAVANAHLGLARNADARAAANEGKPQIVTDNAGNFFSVDPRSAQGRPVTDQAGGTLNKGDKPLTEVQGNATAFGMRMTAANKIINGLEDKGFDTGKLSNMLANNRTTNYAASPEAQELYQAKLNFMSASLRKESGAAISQSEYDAEDKKYFPQPGDSRSVKQQKRQMRDLALEAMARQAGPAGAKAFAGQSQAQGGLSPAEQGELDALRKRFGR